MKFAELAANLLRDVRYLLPEWLPGGRVLGLEYCCGSTSGGEGQSLKVNIETGKWADFATSDKGGDLVSLFAAINNLTQKEALDKLTSEHPESMKNPPNPPKQRAKCGTPPPLKFITPPKGTKLPTFKNKPTKVWRYKSIKGETLFLICRFDNGEKKTFSPYSFTDQNKWVRKHWPSPRPLYNLDLLHEHPSRPVLICEGEKAADAAMKFTEGKYVVTTWSSGSSAVNNTDWTPLHNRNILIWPDADEPGRKAASKIAGLLLGKSKEVKLIQVDGDTGEDAADSGFDWTEFLLWARSKVKYVSKPATSKAKSQPQESNGPIPPPQNTLVVTNEENIPENIPQNLVARWANLGITTSRSTGMPHNNTQNAFRVISNHSELEDLVWYDEFHYKYMTHWRSDTIREWTDIDDLELCLFMQEKVGLFRMTDDLCRKAALMYANRHYRNEPLDWLQTLEWDNEARVSNFFHEYLGADDTDYTRAVSRNWWTSMAARIYKPGCKVDNMVILEGAQGAYKSTALSIIGGPWYVESNESLSSKDFYQVFQGKLIVELGELDAFNKAETTTIKKVVSTSSDRFRPPYGRAPRDFPRQCIFVGTTNEHNYLRDHTGGRRFWPVKIGRINLGKIMTDREQLFAEAVHLFKSGKKWHEVPQSAVDEQESRREVDIWEEAIYDFTSNRAAVLIRDIVRDCLKMDLDRVDQRTTRRIARSLRSLGWIQGPVKKTSDRKSFRAWERGPDADPINFNYMQQSLNGSEQKVSTESVDKSGELSRPSHIKNFAPHS